MAKLFGKEWTQEELRRRAGDISQVAGAERVRLTEGPADGVEAVNFHTGSGFAFQVLPGRGMDIAEASYCGASLSWRSNVPKTHAGHFDAAGLGWLWGFYGGLLTTCGPTYTGSPCEDEGESLGLHGRAANLQASNVDVDGEWNGDEYTFWAKGKLREARFFGSNVEITRRITARLGENRLLLSDRVQNNGFAAVPHQWLYHINIGWPVVDADSELVATSRVCTPRDDTAAAGLDRAMKGEPPIPGFEEQVFFHDMAADEAGNAMTAMVNRSFADGRGIGVYVRYPRETLPYLVEWKMTGEGAYVIGMEPANCLVMGRAEDRRAGRLQFLQPGEARTYELEIGVLTDQSAIDAYAAAVAQVLAGASS